MTDKFTKEQELLMRLRDERCDGNAAELARRLGKDATYVNRLLYPVGKAGRKGIGLAVMRAASQAFSLPPGFWDAKPVRTNWPFLEELTQKALTLPSDTLNRIERLIRADLDMPPPKFSLVPTDDRKEDSYSAAPDEMIYSQEQKGLGSAVAEAAVSSGGKRNAVATNKRSPRQKGGRRA